jgi:hypothetical protein
VILEERAIHPFLAEYDYRLQVFASDERDGGFRGTVDLRTNPGGRTHLCLFSLTSSSGAFLLEVVDRNQASLVDLEALSLVADTSLTPERLFLGSFAEDAPPLRFLPPEAGFSCPWGV